MNMVDAERRIAELRREAGLIRAWLRDSRRRKQERLSEIDAKIAALSQESGEKTEDGS